MTQAIMQGAIEEMKTAVNAMSEAAGSAKRNNGAASAKSLSPRVSETLLKQPTFKWKA